jgi:hypothetical protein
MNNLLCQHFVRRGVQVIDFTRGGEAYKNLYTNRTSHNVTLEVNKTSLPFIGASLYEWFKELRPVKYLITRPSIVAAKAQILYSYRTEGPAKLLKKALLKSGRAIFWLRTVCVLRVEHLPDSIGQPKIPVEFRKLLPEQLDEIAAYRGLEVDSPGYRIMRDKFSGGADCFAAYYKGHIISTGWGMYTADTDETDGFVLAPGDGEIAFSDGFTSPVYRNLKIGEFRRAGEIKYYLDKGYKCLTAISSTNAASLRVAQKTGFKKLRVERTLRIFGFKVF